MRANARCLFVVRSGSLGIRLLDPILVFDILPILQLVVPPSSLRIVLPTLDKHLVIKSIRRGLPHPDGSSNLPFPRSLTVCQRFRLEEKATIRTCA